MLPTRDETARRLAEKGVEDWRIEMYFRFIDQRRYGKAQKVLSNDICGARRRYGRGRCAAPPMPGKTRCYWHGGPSAGAKTADGKQRQADARARRWAAWREAGRPDWMPAAARQAIGDAQRKRWARHRQEKERQARRAAILNKFKVAIAAPAEPQK